MPEDDTRAPMKTIPNSLTFEQAHVNFILGHSLARLYQDVLMAPVPEHLQALLDQMAEQQSAEDEDPPPEPR